MKDQLLENFSPSKFEDWIKVAESETKKKVSDREDLEIDSNLTIRSYYDAAGRKETPNVLLKTGKDDFFGPRSWANIPPIEVLDEKDSNKKALHALNTGSDGVLFVIKKENCDVQNLLKGIDLGICQVHFKFEKSDVSFCQKFSEYALKHHSANKIYGGFIDSDHFIIPSEFQHYKSLGFSAKGIPTIQQLADLLYTTVLRIEAHEDITPNTVLENIYLSFTTQSNFFLEIAKLRALRILWSHLIEAYGVSDINLFIHSSSGVDRIEDYEPHSNILHGAFSAMASILGGCDGLSIFPEKMEDAMVSRIAQNIPIILREESNLHRVADPVAGSYFLEQLTNSIVEKSWNEFVKLTSS